MLHHAHITISAGHRTAHGDAGVDRVGGEAVEGALHRSTRIRELRGPADGQPVVGLAAFLPAGPAVEAAGREGITLAGWTMSKARPEAEAKETVAEATAHHEAH